MRIIVFQKCEPYIFSFHSKTGWILIWSGTLPSQSVPALSALSKWIWLGQPPQCGNLNSVCQLWHVNVRTGWGLGECNWLW